MARGGMKSPECLQGSGGEYRDGGNQSIYLSGEW